MIILAFSLLAALWGGTLARKRQGTRLDIAQYAASFAIFGAIVGLIVTMIVERML